MDYFKVKYLNFYISETENVVMSRNMYTCRLEGLLTTVVPAYLPGLGVNHDHEGGSPRTRLVHCTSGELASAISPNGGNSEA